ncbi:DUF3987 domain-containing protein [Rhodovulum sp. YNF3179]|uniref:DUF3987 domain-containing protein n=1 Tax=Rhodovulum sp. YNF3179 TaxID=3425127 RepID=UPI003D34F799
MTDFDDPTPELETIRQFLGHTTRGWGERVGHDDFVVELSALDRGRRIQRSFEMTEGWAEEAAAWASERNREGANLYWVPQPKGAGARHRHARDADIPAFLTCFLDQDEEGAVAVHDLGVEPSVVVRTGTTPHERRHVYFDLSEPLGDQERWRALQRALAAFGRGDPQCVNPARLMRLPGTVSHPSPTKIERGYVAELVAWSTGTATLHDVSALEEAFGCDDRRETSSNASDERTTDARSSPRRAILRQLSLDRRLLDLLTTRRNTLPVGSYATWRNIAFGTIDKYRDTAFEEEARTAFIDFSLRWENGETARKEIDRLWASEDDDKPARIGAGTAIMELEKLPPLGPPPDPDGGHAMVAEDDSPATEIAFTGLAKRLHEALERATDRRAGEVHLGGVLAALSALAGPSAVIRNGVMGPCCTNLYVLALARTAYGKEAIRTLLASLLDEVGRRDEVFDGSPSDVSFHATLSRQAGRATLMIDEAGILAKAMKSHSQSWQRMLMSLLMQVYGRGLTSLEARRYKDTKNDIEAVEHPRPTLMLTSTIKDFTEGTSQEDSSSGFFNRLTVFVDRELPELRGRDDLPDRQAVVEFSEDVQSAIRRLKGVDHGPFVPGPVPKIAVWLSDDALERMIDFKFGEVEARIRSGDLAAETWGRAVENAQRIAGLLAVSDALMTPEASLDRVPCERRHVDLAISIMRRGLIQLEEIARNAGRTGGQLDRVKDRVLQVLEKAGGTATRNHITRHALRNVPDDRRSGVLNAMVEDGEIEQTVEAISGKPGIKPTMYRLPRKCVT